MKRLFFTLVFVFVTSFGFANDNRINEQKIDKNTTILSLKEISKLSNITYTIEENIILRSCHLTVKGEIDGKPVDLDMTYDADDCVAGAIRILKEVAADM
ncbi:hypothetical protein KO500_15265 [Cellulophaga baltica]|uniref:hypothetical protein n=1 Tax=Cellulophaga TaxID=104264 RepID=UPI001C0676F8|nr:MULTISPECIES: hypothetical protein [Cellulophaga]MBU2997808.1 hypothetical protein [Cellulophaga baltica]MDO6769204.1 hypothetical protein [Cellulophaga sp. 1_MG-2023]